MRKWAMMLGVAALCGAAAGSAQNQLNGASPDPARQHHQRSNCHGVYDMLVEADSRGQRLSAAEMNFVNEYEMNAQGGQPCPDPGEELSSRAVNRTVVTQEALYQLTQYVQQPDPAAYYELGYTALMGNAPGVDRQLGVDTLYEAADMGDGPAHFLLGLLNANGTFGSANMAEALRHFEAAAQTGHVDALYYLGLFHADGQGTRKDPARGLEYLRQAAELGHINATFTAANMVNTGQGVKEDYDLAYRLGRNLVDQGQVVGAVIAASALLQMRNVKQNQDEVLYWMDLAERHGDAKIRSDIARFRPQVKDIFDRMNAPPAYKPRERKLCSLKTVCYVDRYTARRSCNTNVDYWSDCNTDPRF